MCTHENPGLNREATLYLNDDERLLLYQYAYHELHVSEIVEEIAFLSDDERRSILECVRLLKKSFFKRERQSREHTGETK